MADTTNGAVTTTRPKPQRRFEIRIGDIAVTKRCSVVDMAAILDKTDGVSASLILDGYEFEMVGAVEKGD